MYTTLSADLAAAERQERLNRQLAALALQDIARRHRIETAKARAQHRRRPLVKLV